MLRESVKTPVRYAITPKWVEVQTDDQHNTNIAAEYADVPRQAAGTRGRTGQ
jgi:hypothetical protein